MKLIIDIDDETYKNVTFYGMFLCPRDEENLEKALKNARFFEGLPEKKWISCSERLPTEDGVYLIAYEALGGGYGYDADTFHQNKNKFGWYNGDGEAIAWMPIPELYTTNTKGEQHD